MTLSYPTPIKTCIAIIIYNYYLVFNQFYKILIPINYINIIKKNI